MRLVVVVFPFALLFASCGFDRNLVGKHDEVVNKALSEVSLFSEFKTLYPDSKHFISYIGIRGKPKTWNSKTGLYGRYTLHMAVPVSVDPGNLKVQLTGTPTFHLYEVASIGKAANGNTHISYADTINVSVEQWAKLVSNHGNWNAAGISLKTDKPVAGFRDYWVY